MKSPIKPEALIAFHNKLSDEAFRTKLKQDSTATLADCGIILAPDIKVNFYEEGEIVPPNTDKVLNITLPPPTALAQLSEQQLDNVSAGGAGFALATGALAVAGPVLETIIKNPEIIERLETKAKNVINALGKTLGFEKVL